MSDSLQPHGLQYSRLPCPSPTPRAYSNSCPSSQWCHPTISSSVVPFSSHLQSFPASTSFLMSQFFASGGQSMGVQLQHQSFHEYSGLIYFRMDWLNLLVVQGTLKSLLQHHSSKASILQHSAFFIVQLSHPYMTTGKTIALTRWTFVDKVMSLLFNMLSRLVIAFLPRRKCLLISWLQPPSAVILEPPKIKSLTISIVSPSICHEVMGADAMILVFWMLSFKPTFSLSSFTFITVLMGFPCVSILGWGQEEKWVTEVEVVGWHHQLNGHACLPDKSLQSFLTLCDTMDHSLPGSSVHGLFRQENWSRLQCPSPGDLPSPGIKPLSLTSPALTGGFFIISATCEAPMGHDFEHTLKDNEGQGRLTCYSPGGRKESDSI